MPIFYNVFASSSFFSLFSLMAPGSLFLSPLCLLFTSFLFSFFLSSSYFLCFCPSSSLLFCWIMVAMAISAYVFPSLTSSIFLYFLLSFYFLLILPFALPSSSHCSHIVRLINDKQINKTVEIFGRQRNKL